MEAKKHPVSLLPSSESAWRHNSMNLLEAGIDSDHVRQAQQGISVRFGPWCQCACGNVRWKGHGYTKRGAKRWRCLACGATILGNTLRSGEFDQERAFGMFTDPSRLERAGFLLRQGWSIRRVSRETKLDKMTVSKLLHGLNALLETPLVCDCGKELTKHKGFCKRRFQESHSRQRFMASWRSRPGN